MDIVDKVAAQLWATRMENRGDAHAAAQRLYEVGLLRQPDPPVLTINVRIPAVDVRPPTGLVVDVARGVVTWEGLNYYARPDSAEPGTWTVCFECDGCGAETEVARNEAGWHALNTIGWSGDPDVHVFCLACTKDGWRTAAFGSEEEQEKPPGVLGVKCCRCGTTGGFQSQDDILAPLALTQAGWQLLLADEPFGFVCPDCVERDSCTKDGWAPAEFGKVDRLKYESSPPPSWA